MIARRLVDEAAAGLVPRDQAGLRAIKQDVREVDLALERAREIERVHCVLGIDGAAGRLSGHEAVAARARECTCVFDRRIRVVLLLQLGIGAKAASREDDRASHPNSLALLADIDHRALDAAVTLYEFDQLRLVFDWH